MNTKPGVLRIETGLQSTNCPNCWEIKACSKKKCPARESTTECFRHPEIPCDYEKDDDGNFVSRITRCVECEIGKIQIARLGGGNLGKEKFRQIIIEALRASIGSVLKKNERDRQRLHPTIIFTFPPN